MVFFFYTGQRTRIFPSPCLYCLRRKQRLLAALSAFTALSLLLLLFHTSTPSPYLPTVTERYREERELPDRGNYYGVQRGVQRYDIGVMITPASYDYRVRYRDGGLSRDGVQGLERLSRDGVQRYERLSRDEAQRYERLNRDGTDWIDRDGRLNRDGVQRYERLSRDGVQRYERLSRDGALSRDGVQRYERLNKDGALSRDGVQRYERLSRDEAQRFERLNKDGALSRDGVQRFNRDGQGLSRDTYKELGVKIIEQRPHRDTKTRGNMNSIRKRKKYHKKQRNKYDRETDRDRKHETEIKMGKEINRKRETEMDRSFDRENGIIYNGNRKYGIEIDRNYAKDSKADIENGINQDTENGINHDGENGINHDRENGINHDAKNGINHDRENGINHDRENGINYNIENGINYDRVAMNEKLMQNGGEFRDMSEKETSLLRIGNPDYNKDFKTQEDFIQESAVLQNQYIIPKDLIETQKHDIDTETQQKNIAQDLIETRQKNIAQDLIETRQKNIAQNLIETRQKNIAQNLIETREKNIQDLEGLRKQNILPKERIETRKEKIKLRQNIIPRRNEEKIPQDLSELRQRQNLIPKDSVEQQNQNIIPKNSVDLQNNMIRRQNLIPRDSVELRKQNILPKDLNELRKLNIIPRDSIEIRPNVKLKNRPKENKKRYIPERRQKQKVIPKNTIRKQEKKPNYIETKNIKNQKLSIKKEGDSKPKSEIQDSNRRKQDRQKGSIDGRAEGLRQKDSIGQKDGLRQKDSDRKEIDRQNERPERDRKITYKHTRIIPSKNSTKNQIKLSKTRTKNQGETVETNPNYQRKTKLKNQQKPSKINPIDDTESKRQMENGKPKISRQKPSRSKSLDSGIKSRKVPERQPKDSRDGHKNLLDLGQPFSPGHTNGIEVPAGFDLRPERSINQTNEASNHSVQPNQSRKSKLLNLDQPFLLDRGSQVVQSPSGFEPKVIRSSNRTMGGLSHITPQKTPQKHNLLDLHRPFMHDEASEGVKGASGFNPAIRSMNRSSVISLVAEEGGEEGEGYKERKIKGNILLLDYSRPSYFPWRTTNDECANYATRFLVGGHAPLIAMASFPGSGNTWLRYLTEALTGVFTGSVYHDEVLALKGLWGERDGYRQGTTLLQKTHSFPLLPEELQDGLYHGGDFRFLLPPVGNRRVIVLIRSPWEALLALRHYHAAGHTGFATQAFFTGAAWRNFTIERAELWVKLYTAWLSLPKTNILVLHYESLQHHLEQEALRLMDFLGIPIDYGRLECIVRYPEGRFRRPKYPKHLQGYTFAPEAGELLRRGINQIDQLLINHQHPPLPTHLYSFTPLINKQMDFTARPLVRAPFGG